MKKAILDWGVFALVHVVVIAENLFAPNQPLGDVLWTYPKWIYDGILSGNWHGLTSPGVYPFLALIPMFFGYLGVAWWFGFVTVFNGVAFGALRSHSRRAALAWMLFVALLGPITVGRIDVVTVALGIIVIAVTDSSPRLAGALIAVATWIKVWPVVFGLTTFLTTRARTIAVWAVLVAVGCGTVAAIIGGPANVLSFLGGQQGRGIQVESVAATPWLWDAFAGGGSTVFYSQSLITFEVRGESTTVVASALILIEVVFVALLALRIVQHRRRMTGEITTHILALALSTLIGGLIVINKVGSPQFVSWLAVPVVALVLYWHPRWSPPLLSLIAVIALQTHILYPYAYFDFLNLQAGPLVVATARNLAEVALLVTAGVALLRELRLEELTQQGGDGLVVDKKSVVTEG